MPVNNGHATLPPPSPPGSRPSPAGVCTCSRKRARATSDVPGGSWATPHMGTRLEGRGHLGLGELLEHDDALPCSPLPAPRTRLQLLLVRDRSSHCYGEPMDADVRARVHRRVPAARILRGRWCLHLAPHVHARARHGPPPHRCHAALTRSHRGVVDADQAARLYGPQQRPTRAPCGPRAVAPGVRAYGMRYGGASVHARKKIRCRVRAFARACLQRVRGTCGGGSGAHGAVPKASGRVYVWLCAHTHTEQPA